MSDPTPTPSAGVLARFFVDEVTRRAYNPDHVVVKLKASSRGEQNKTWAQFTPSGTMELTVNNPAAAAFFAEHLGQDLELRFSEVSDDRYIGEHATAPVPPA